MPWSWLRLDKIFRRRAPAPAVPPTRTEADQPVDKRKLDEFIFQSITANREHKSGRKVNYAEHLKDRQIKPEKLPSRVFVFVFGTSLAIPFVIALILSTITGMAFSCSENWYSRGCKAQVSSETVTASVQRQGRFGLRTWRETTTKEIRVEPQEREVFNFVVFQAVLVAFAFSIGFARWQIGNRQAALNTVFDRKKELNLLFLDGEKRQILEPLIRGATDPDEMIQARGVKVASREQAVAILNKCQSISELGSNQLIDIGKKVFVFMELDNLEFAYEKYNRGYLDAEQMHRACEILESRCLNREFRYLAVTQGLVYYNKNFHCIVAACIVRGYLLSGGAIPAVASTA